LYDPPKYPVIVEPFAGSARYALEYWQNEVKLYDLSEYVVKVWEYLMQATEDEVLALPDVPSKVHLDNYTQLSDAEKYLIGFHLCRGKAVPRKVGHGLNSWSKDKVRIASQLYKIRHWSIEQASYTDIPNIKATYFIDPPYKATQERKGNSDRYKHGSLDYEALGEWIKSRQGQVIACEGSGADYLPFEFLKEATANTNNKSSKHYNEYIYTQ
jgi:hypothetical protein